MEDKLLTIALSEAGQTRIRALKPAARDMLDLILPVTDDEDNQEQVAAVRAFSTAPLVLLTNYHGEARRLRDLANGADFIRFRLYSFRLVAAKVATLTQRWPRRVASASAGEARGSGPAWC